MSRTPLGRGRASLRSAGLSALAVVLGACGEADAADPSGDYDVVLVVGAAIADEGADLSAFPGEGSSFEERWALACDDEGCELTRPEGGVLLGDLEVLALAPVEDAERTWRGTATGVQPEPGVEPPDVDHEADDADHAAEHAHDDACEGSTAQTWTVEIELTERDGALVGSVFRVPGALVDGDCFGLDLTLGLSGTRR